MGNHLALDGVAELDPAFRSQHVAALIMAAPTSTAPRSIVRSIHRLGIPVTIYGSTPTRR